MSKQSSVSSTHFGYTGWWRLLPQPSYSDLANNLFASACAGTSKGHSFSYNCSLPTYEMCVQEVIAGNRGFCSPNPYYRRPEFVPPRAKRKRYYY